MISNKAFGIKISTIDNNGPYLQNIRVSDITMPIMPTHVDSAKIVSLAENIRRVGLIHPIYLLAKNDSEQNGFEYKLICGYRRLAAFRLLERQTIPARILTSESTADNIMLCEYCTSEHSDYYFTADILKYMINVREYSLHELAVILGSSETHLRSILRLSVLTPEERRKAIKLPLELVMKAAEFENPISRGAVIDYLFGCKENIRLPSKANICSAPINTFNLKLIENSIAKLVERIHSTGLDADFTGKFDGKKLTYHISISDNVSRETS